MNNEFTIQEVQEMLQETHITRKENLRLQSGNTKALLFGVGVIYLFNCTQYKHTRHSTQNTSKTDIYKRLNIYLRQIYI